MIDCIPHNWNFLNNFSAMSVEDEDTCIRCKEAIRARQEGLQCDACDWWQHRQCNSGVSQKDCHAAVRSRQDIDW